MGLWFEAGTTTLDDIVAKAYGLSSWPTYPKGMGYVLGGNITHALAKLEVDLGLVDGYPEDAVVGLWLCGLSHDRVLRVNSPCFINDGHDSGCSDDAIMVHYMTPETWAMIDAEGRPRLCAGRKIQ